MQVQVPEDTANCHLPEPADREVKRELGTVEDTADRKGEGEDCVRRQDEQCSFLEVLEDDDQKDWPDNVKLFLDTERPQVEERVVADVSVEVPFLMHEDLEVGGEDEWRVDSVETEDFEVVFNNKLDDPEGETEDEDEDGVQSFDAATVKVDKGELVLVDFLDDDLGDEETGDDEEDVDSDESSGDGFGPGVVNDNRNDSNRSHAINLRSVVLVMTFG